MRRLFGCLGLALAMLATPVFSANPYDAAMTVNGAVITQYDITQRERLLGALGATENVRELATQQLIEDRLKVQLGARFGLELPEDAILAGLEEFATQRGMTIDDVLNILTERNIDRQAMDDFVEAGIVWREFLGARFRDRAEPSEEAVDRALQEFRNTPVRAYQLAEIALPYAERGVEETGALAGELVRQLRRGTDFAITAFQFSRSPTAQNGGIVAPMREDQLTPEMSSQITTMSAGEISDPIPITGGLAIIKLVSVQNQFPELPTEQDVFEQRERLRLQLFSDRVTGYGRGLLQEMVTDADIVRR